MGALFRLLRFKAKITQTRIATAAGLTQGRVSHITRGKQHGPVPGRLHAGSLTA